MGAPGGAGPAAGPAARRPLPAPVAVALLTAPGLFAFAVPFFGAVLSGLAALFAADRVGPSLWGAGRRWWLVAALGFGALWLPSVLSLLGAFAAAPAEPAPWVVANALLVMPLCGPENPWPPVAVAVGVYAVGAGLSVRLRRLWPWVVAGPAAALAYGMTVQLAPIELLC